MYLRAGSFKSPQIPKRLCPQIANPQFILSPQIFVFAICGTYLWIAQLWLVFRYISFAKKTFFVTLRSFCILSSSAWQFFFEIWF
jgi:hypothetical protein